LANPVPARGPDHKRAGAILASKYANSLVFLIAGHHGGLQDREVLKSWVRGKAGDTAAEEALAIARSEVSWLEPVCSPCFPPWLGSKTETEFFLRMLFSTLTDADFLDTEQHFEVERSATRGTSATLGELGDPVRNESSGSQWQAG
jgi:CRISPR-associated endonuclease/helicase Cas3